MGNDGKLLVKSIGKGIQFWRNINGLDQRELSEMIQTSRSYVAKVENALVGISVKKIARFAEALGVSPYTLLQGIPNDDDLEILLDIYADRKINITKEEMEFLFSQKIFKGSGSLKYYEHLLCLERGWKYRCTKKR